MNIKVRFTVGTTGRSKILHAMNPYWKELGVTKKLCDSMTCARFTVDHTKDFPTCKSCAKVIRSIEKRQGTEE